MTHNLLHTCTASRVQLGLARLLEETWHMSIAPHLLAHSSWIELASLNYAAVGTARRINMQSSKSATLQHPPWHPPITIGSQQVLHFLQYLLVPHDCLHSSF